MIISLIVAMDEKRGISRAGHLPWHLRADLQRFKQVTMGHHLIMGRKTFESIGRALPGRVMIVITRNRKLQIPDGYVAHLIEDALAIAENNHENEVFIIGGGSIFAQTVAIANRIYLTQVHTDSQADIFFPEIKMTSWSATTVQEHPADIFNEYSFTFKLLEKNSC